MVFTRVLANNMVWEKIKFIKWNPHLMVFTWVLVKTVTWGEINIIKWTVQTGGVFPMLITCKHAGLGAGLGTPRERRKESIKRRTQHNGCQFF